jgi:hypothetical protein
LSLGTARVRRHIAAHADGTAPQRNEIDAPSICTDPLRRLAVACVSRNSARVRQHFCAERLSRRRVPQRRRLAPSHRLVAREVRNTRQPRRLIAQAHRGVT